VTRSRSTRRGEWQTNNNGGIGGGPLYGDPVLRTVTSGSPVALNLIQQTPSSPAVGSIQLGAVVVSEIDAVIDFCYPADTSSVNLGVGLIKAQLIGSGAPPVIDPLSLAQAERDDWLLLKSAGGTMISDADLTAPQRMSFHFKYNRPVRIDEGWALTINLSFLGGMGNTISVVYNIRWKQRRVM